MSADVITQTDNHYSEEIDHLLLKMIDQVSEIQMLFSCQPNQIPFKFKNDFVPRFVKLYDLTSDYLESNHMKDTDKDKEIRKTLEDTIYFLNGIARNNSHAIAINKESVNEGIDLFRKYKKYLHREGIMVVH
jgi:hypothetical protein